MGVHVPSFQLQRTAQNSIILNHKYCLTINAFYELVNPKIAIHKGHINVAEIVA
jgi:hypothetical protein